MNRIIATSRHRQPAFVVLPYLEYIQLTSDMKPRSQDVLLMHASPLTEPSLTRLSS